MDTCCANELSGLSARLFSIVPPRNISEAVCNWTLSRRLWALVLAAALLSVASNPTEAQGTVSAPCNITHWFNQWHQFSWTGPLETVTGIQFLYGQGLLEPQYSGKTYGVYDQFGEDAGYDIIDNTHEWILSDAWYGMQSCWETPIVGPSGDTTWTDELDVVGDYGGTVGPLVQADASVCSDGSSGGGGTGGGPGGPPPEEDCSGEAGGGEGTEVEVCDYLVLADEYGNPILDAGGDYIVIADLGCHLEET